MVTLGQGCFYIYGQKGKTGVRVIGNDESDW